MSTKSKQPNISRIERRNVANPLEVTTSASANLPKLPFEIWHEIFTYAIPALPSSFDSTVLNSYTPLRTMMMCQQPALLADLSSWKKPGLYGARRDLTLVCKSWYLVANPILWKNIRIDLRHPMKQIKNLCCTLEQNPALAENVVCMVIRASEWLIYSLGTHIDKELAEELQKVVLFSKVFPMMKRLKMLQCPRLILEMVDWDLKMEVVMVYEQCNRPIRSGPLFLGSHCWKHCHTLIITHLDTSPPPRGFESAAVVFPNLVNLRIRVDNDTAIHHITVHWNLPRLRNLSITSAGMVQWTKLLERARLTIETLELSIMVSFDGALPQPTPPITMQNLFILCLQDARADSAFWWIRYIIAPQLGRIIFYPTQIRYIYGPNPSQQEDSLELKMNAAVVRYSTLREMAVVIGDCWNLEKDKKEWMSGLVKLGMVARWCKRGLVVEEIEENTGNMRRFTLNNLKHGYILLPHWDD